MKTVAILLSLAIGATAQHAEGEANSSIRAAKVVTKRAKQNAQETTGNKLPSTAHPSKDHAARERRSHRRALGNSLHKKLFNNDRGLKETATKKNDDETAETGRKTQKKAKKIHDRELQKTTAKQGQGEDRELKKAKSAKDFGSRFDLDDDSMDNDDPNSTRPGDDDMVSPDYYGSKGGKKGSGKSGKAGYGKSAKGYDGYYEYYEHSKSAEGYDEYYGYSKSAKGYGSGKSGKSGGDGGGCRGDYAYVTITNLSFKQSLSEIFAMTATSEVTYRKPTYVFGNRTNSALAELAQNATADGMVSRYEDYPGVEDVDVFRDFFGGKSNAKYLRGGSRTVFKVRTSGDGDRLTIAAGMPFTNDGAVVLEGARMYDGAEYSLPAIDVGAEGNIQTCWSVAAMKDDFPFNAECSDTSLSNMNDNDIPGENFVSMHRGIHDFDSQEELNDLLTYPTCEDYNLNPSASNQADGYAQYFWETGYDDDLLLCQDGNNGGNCNYREDTEFLDFIGKSPIFNGEDDRIIDLAKTSSDFDAFCKLIQVANDLTREAFKTLESHIFDWRNDIAHVEIDCRHSHPHAKSPSNPGTGLSTSSGRWGKSGKSGSSKSGKSGSSKCTAAPSISPSISAKPSVSIAPSVSQK